MKKKKIASIILLLKVEICTLGSDIIKSCTFAIFAASTIRSNDTFSSNATAPYAILSFIEQSNKIGS